MSIKINLLNNPGFIHSDAALPKLAENMVAVGGIAQQKKFKKIEIQNGYGTATTVSVSPGYGAKVSADISIQVNTVSSETFTQMINEVKKSSSYKNNSSFQKDVDASSYSSAASSSSGIFGWLVGKNSSSYTNNHSDMTEAINSADSGDASNDKVVANSLANIMVKSSSKVMVNATVQVTGQLLVPSPTVIAVQSTVFSFTNKDGSTSSVSMLNQTPLVPVDASSGTVSQNTLAPGSKLTLSPIS